MNQDLMGMGHIQADEARDGRQGLSPTMKGSSKKVGDGQGLANRRLRKAPDRSCLVDHRSMERKVRAQEAGQ